jgi:hypothetical protein
VTFGSPILTVRVGNRTQIMRKEVIISGTQEAVDKAGRNSELVRQMANKRKELYRDREFVFLSNQAPVTGNSSTAPQLRPVLGWITTNASRGAGGANGTSSAAATDGTQRTFTEAMLVTAMQTAWTQGGSRDAPCRSEAACGGFVLHRRRHQVPADERGQALRHDHDLRRRLRHREGDCGSVHAWRAEQCRPRGAGARSRPVGRGCSPSGQGIDIAKTGDSEKGVILTETTLESLQEAGNAIIADLT